MESLSISASVAGLATIAEMIYVKGMKYARGVKEAPNEVKTLLAEVNELSVLLRKIYLLALILEDDSTKEDSEHTQFLKFTLLWDCQKSLTHLEKGLDETSNGLGSSSKVRRVVARLKWPFSSTETKEILDKVHRQRETMSLALTAESVFQLRQGLSVQADTNNRVKHLQQEVKIIHDIQLRTVLDEKRSKVLKSFHKIDSRSDFEMVKSLRHPATGLWLTEGPDFEKWYTIPHSRLWLFGIPGAGKSVLAGAMISECLQRNGDDPTVALGYVFCTHRNKDTHNPVNILSCLARQIARQSASAYIILEAYYEELQSDDLHNPTSKRLIEVFVEMCALFTQVQLIIDGLDECDSSVDRVLETLRSLAPIHTLTNIKMALLSRDEFDIRTQLEIDFHSIQLEAQKEDIRLYVASELNERIQTRKLRLRDMTLKEKILTHLVDEAKGMFRWVFCQLEHMCHLPTDKDRRIALKKLPPTLYETYERILMRAQARSAHAQMILRRTLKILAAASFNYSLFSSISAIREAVSVPDDSDVLEDDAIVDEEEILRICGCLVRKTSSKESLEFAHFTVQEFLRDACPTHPQLSAYGISKESANELLCYLCLRYLTLKNRKRQPAATLSDFKRLEARNKSHPFYHYATATWWVCLDRESPSPRVSALLNSLFSSSKTAMFSSWAIEHILMISNDFAVPMDEDRNANLISAVLRPDFTPLHMAAVLGLHDVCIALISKTNIDQRSKFGTPLHCAIASYTAFSYGKLRMHPSMISGRQQTIRVLLDQGASLQLKVVTLLHNYTTIFSLAVSLFCIHEQGSDVLVDLIKAKVPIAEIDFPNITCLLNHDMEICFYKGATGSISPADFFERFISALVASTGEINYSRLYDLTCEHARRAGVNVNTTRSKTLSKSSLELPGWDVSDAEAVRFLTKVIQHNDASTLGQFLNGRQSRVINSTRFGSKSQSWTALHLAIAEEALDVVRLLLEAGCDPNATSSEGESPLDLCASENILRALIHHGGSTTVPGKDGETIWHIAARKHPPEILMVLLELDVKADALKMQSDHLMTPICTALDATQKKNTLILLPHCGSKDFWRSGKSLFRAAAKTGYSCVLEKMLELNLDLDGVDEKGGNPLHYLDPGAELELVQKLKRLFPLHQKRGLDERTPFESTLIQSLESEQDVNLAVLTSLISENINTQSVEASQSWVFICSETVTRALEKPNWPGWFVKLHRFFLELGIARQYESETKLCAMIPLCSSIIRFTMKWLRRKQFVHSIYFPKLEDCFTLGEWARISDISLLIAKESTLLSDSINHHDIVGLFFEAIIHRDDDIIKLLLDIGADVHAPFEDISLTEFASAPRAHLSEANFGRILSHAIPDKLTDGNHQFEGKGLLHIMAHNSGYYGAERKLERLLQTGLDCNSPVSFSEKTRPLAYHISHSRIQSVQLLLRFGADPCIGDYRNLDAPLTAVWRGEVEYLDLLAEFGRDGKALQWNQACSFSKGDLSFAGGNALHLAALLDFTECLKFYVNNRILCDLDVIDNDGQTPLHHAARTGWPLTIEFLVKQGANINATSKSGKTPLHEAVIAEHLKAVEMLLELGSSHAVCFAGCSPVVYAYATGNSGITELLMKSAPTVENFETANSRSASVMADALYKAMARKDLTRCQKLLDSGCPLNIAIKTPRGYATPLMAAIHEVMELDVIEWLLQNGVGVSPLIPKTTKMPYSTALEAAVSQPRLNGLLDPMIVAYLDEGGNFLDHQRSPLHVAVEEQNLEGLRILLNALRGKYLSQEITVSHCRHLSSYSGEAASIFQALVNQGHVNENRTPLHEAALLNDAAAALLLIDNGASVNCIDKHGQTPLHYTSKSRSSKVAKLLLDRGARGIIRDCYGRTPLFLACCHAAWELLELLIQRSDSNFELDASGYSPLVHLIQSKYPPLDSLPLHLLMDAGWDLHQENSSGLTPAHHLLSSRNTCFLEWVITENACLLRAREIQWPESIIWDTDESPVAVMERVTKSFILLRSHLSDDEMYHISDQAIPEKHNLICRAACLNAAASVQNFITIKANIEHQCRKHGTPLQAAACYGNLSAFKILVRNGARVPYPLLHSEIKDAHGFRSVLNWLVGPRFVEQSKITFDPADVVDKKPAAWSGGVTMRVQPKWGWRRTRDETMQEYEIRKKDIVSGLQGKVFPSGIMVGSIGGTKRISLMRRHSISI